MHDIKKNYEVLKERLMAGMLWFFYAIYPFISPLTFVWLIYEDAKQSHSFLEWLMLIVLDMILAALWPIYWSIELIKWIF